MSLSTPATPTPATPEPEREKERKKGPWANRVVSSEIVPTAEYEEFIAKLAEYHEKRGTTLVREPELGRKLLDLRKLYATVTELGGYDKITEQKGAWRDIANTYKAPVNNSNAGYLLKTIYYKNLAAYEISYFFNKEPPPKEWLEDRSAAGGAIMTRTAEDFMTAPAGSPKAEMTGDSQSPPPSTSEKRSLRQQPTPRSFFAPDTTPQRASNQPRSSSQQQQTPLHNQSLHQQPAANGAHAQVYSSGNAHHFPDFRPGPHTLPLPRAVLTPRTAPGSFASSMRRPRVPEINGVHNQQIGPRLGAGHHGANLMHRITMSLKSKLPDDVEFSMASLVRISFEAGDDLRADHWPALVEILWGMVKSVVELVQRHGSEDNVYSTEYTHKLEEINEATLVLRNMSLNPDNAKRFAILNKPKDVLLEGLKLPDHPNLMELKHNLLDITEGMANWLPFSVNDTLLDVIAYGLESPDRGVLLGSMRAICRLVIGRDEFNRLRDIPFSSVQRIASILMLEDDELVSGCLDFLYQYTNHEENIARLMKPPEGYELIRQLVRLLLFQGITGEQLVYIKMVKKARTPTHDIPQLPDEIVRDLLTYSEPDRATKWMRCCFEEDSEADITQIALWQAYQARFNEYVSSGFPLLPAAEFIKNVSVAFQTASAMVLPTPQGQKFIIKGIRARETPMNTKGHVYLACKWFNTPGNAISKCTAQLATPQDLWAHILNTHLTPPVDPSVASRPLWCNWGGCPRFGADGERDRLKVIAHVRTHMPDTKQLRALSKEEQEMLDDPEARVIIRRCQTVTDERGEAGGIPLTSVLVLRNLRKRGGEEARFLIDGWREDLAEVMAVNKPLAQWVGDLLVGGLGGVE